VTGSIYKFNPRIIDSPSSPNPFRLKKPPQTNAELIAKYVILIANVDPPEKKLDTMVMASDQPRFCMRLEKEFFVNICQHTHPIKLMVFANFCAGSPFIIAYRKAATVAPLEIAVTTFCSQDVSGSIKMEAIEATMAASN
jgi:hypothetical protein